jgi:hypothetical protein
MDNNHYGYLYVYTVLSLNLRKGKTIFTAIDNGRSSVRVQSRATGCKARAVWEKLSPEVEAKEAATDVANHPEDEDSHGNSHFKVS